MAFSSLVNTWTTWYLNNRPGPAAGGTPGTCLVSDLQAGDFLVGQRAHIVSTGSTTSGNRTLTVERTALGVQSTITLVAASSLLIIRP